MTTKDATSLASGTYVLTMAAGYRIIAVTDARNR